MANDLRGLVASRVARPLDPADDDLPLGGSGLGLDSIAIAELLLEIEQQFGVTVTDLLAGETLTLRALLARVGG
ncbi:MAG TPA: phosphopantetheine-binding protein [Thermoanaerobaculia bacterium]|jgi:acyl carrier protein